MDIGQIRGLLTLRDEMTPAILAGSAQQRAALDQLKQQLKDTTQVANDLQAAMKQQRDSPFLKEAHEEATRSAAALKSQINDTKAAIDDSSRAAKAHAEAQAASAAMVREHIAAQGQLATALTSTGNILTVGVTAPIVGAAAAAVDFATKFETNMVRVQTLGGASAQEMTSLRDKVLELAPAVGVGPAELAKGLFPIESAGFRGAEAMDILTRAAKMSAIGMGDMETNTRAIVGAMLAFHNQGLTAAQAADILVSTVQKGNMPVDQLTGALGRVNAIAAMAGVTFEEVGAAIATFTHMGVSSAEAVTGLRAIIMNLEAPSARTRDELGRLGLSADELRQSIREKGLNATLADLFERTNGNIESLHNLIPNVRGLAEAMSNTGQNLTMYRQNVQDIKASHDVLNDSFTTVQGTLAQMWREFRATIDVLLVKMGEELLPQLKAMIPALEGVVKVIGAIGSAFTALPTSVQTFVEVMIGIGAVAGPVMSALGRVLRIWTQIQTAILGAQAAAAGGAALGAGGAVAGATAAAGAGTYAAVGVGALAAGAAGAVATDPALAALLGNYFFGPNRRPGDITLPRGDITLPSSAFVGPIQSDLNVDVVASLLGGSGGGRGGSGGGGKKALQQLAAELVFASGGSPYAIGAAGPQSFSVGYSGFAGIPNELPSTSSFSSMDLLPGLGGGFGMDSGFQAGNVTNGFNSNGDPNSNSLLSGLFGGEESSAAKQRTAAALQVAGLLSSHLGGGKAGTALRGALSGLSSGAAIGTMIMPGIGTAIGAGAGAIYGLVSGMTGPSDDEKAARTAAGDFQKQFGTGTFDDMMKAVGDAYAATGRTAQQAQADVKKMLDATHDSAAAVKTQIDLINKAFQEQKDYTAGLKTVFQDVASSNLLMTPQMLRFMNAARSPEDLASVDTFKAQQTTVGIAALSNAVGSMDVSSGNAAGLTGAVSGFMASLQGQGLGVVEIFRQLGPTIQTLGDKLGKAGIDGGAAFKWLQAQAIYFNDDGVKKVVAESDNLNTVLKTLSNTGRLDQDTFAGLSHAAVDSYNSLDKMGKGGISALRAMAPELQTIWQLHKDTGLAIDDETQNLIDMAVKQGVVGDNFRDPQQKMINGINDLIGRFDEFLKRLDGGTKDAANKAIENLNKIPRDFHVGIHEDFSGGSNAPGFASGTAGLTYRDFGSGTTVRLHGKEAVVPQAYAGGFQGGGNGNAGVENRLDSIEHLLTQQHFWIARAVRDAIQKAG